MMVKRADRRDKDKMKALEEKEEVMKRFGA